MLVNMKKLWYISLLLGFIVYSGCASVKTGKSRSKDISPYSYGFSQARNGEERFWALYNTHKAAVAAGVNVDYSGIKKIDLEIPQDAKSIPLTAKSDFAGVEFYVKNTQNDFYLFYSAVKAKPVVVSKQDIDKGDFRSYPELNKGRVLLVVSDDNPWVLNREGYDYGHIRKDILLLKNGKAQNKTVMPYNNEYSSPLCTYYSLKKSGIAVSHITMFRSEDSSKKTFLLRINGIDGLTLEDVTIHTPENQEVKDKAITIADCTNVIFKDVTIDGTYSRSDHSGYGVSLNNIWNFKVRNMYGHGNWGVFGTNNVNVASFEDSDINRFDIHCYGRDISFKNVTFRNKYNQLASVYGTIRFDKCTFIHFCPVLNGQSYNAYVGYDVVMNDCVFDIRRGKNVLIDEGRIDGAVNVRPELAERCIPNVNINNLTVKVPGDVPNVYLFYFRGERAEERELGYLDNVTLTGIKFEYTEDNRAPANFHLSNISLPITRAAKSTLEDIDVIGNAAFSKIGTGRFVKNLQFSSRRSAVRENNIKAQTVE